MNSVFRRRCIQVCHFSLLLALSACGTYPGWISSSGASRELVRATAEMGRADGIRLIDVNDELARKLARSKSSDEFDKVFPASGANHYFIGPGDVIEVSIWEAPPAMLFSTMAPDSAAGLSASRVVTLPEQMVTAEGMITMPFAGRIRVRGRTTGQIESDIGKRLEGKANQAQVLVRVVKSNASNVTVIGEVGSSLLLPLTPKGERLLDALAAGGGVKQPVNRMAIQLSRENVTATMPLDTVIRDPKQNILLKPGDVVTALFQPQSFSVLGATGKNEEIPFEAQGISLAQALARSGGLNDARADARGIFVFRYEEADLVGGLAGASKVADGTVPVIYQVDLRDPTAFFVTQNFPIRNRDVIYVANSPSAEFEKFLRLVVMPLNPYVTINRAFQ